MLFLILSPGGTGDESDSAAVVGQIAERLQTLLAAVLEQAGEEDETMDASTKKLPKMLVAALTQICSLLASTDPQLKTV